MRFSCVEIRLMNFARVILFSFFFRLKIQCMEIQDGVTQRNIFSVNYSIFLQRIIQCNSFREYRYRKWKM